MANPKNPTVLKIQSAAMVRDLALGMNYRQVAKKYGVSKDTVMRRLSYYERAQLFTKAEDTILEGMVPLAEKALMRALEREANSELFEGKPEVALEIFKGTRLLKRDAGKAPSELIPGAADSLEAHIAKLRDRAQQELETTDAELLPEPSRDLLGLPPAPDAGAVPATEPGRPVEGADVPDGQAPAQAGEGGREVDGAVRLPGAGQPEGVSGEASARPAFVLRWLK